jgi:DNA-binding NarL/FixJ family response regulator
MTGRVSVILAEDHAIVRHGLRLLLESEPDITVVGETSDGLEVAALVERLGPDVLVLDIVMPGLNGLDLARELTRARWPRAS